MDAEFSLNKFVSVKGYNERLKTPNKQKSGLTKSPLLNLKN